MRIVPQPLPLATSRYQNVQEDDGLAISVTVGNPRFFRRPLLRLPALAPWELMRAPYKNCDDIPLERRVYGKRLADHRQEILDGLAAIAEANPGQTGILLCFEDVVGIPGEECHRRWAAEWMESEMGWSVPELPARPKATKARKTASRPKADGDPLRLTTTTPRAGEQHAPRPSAVRRSPRGRHPRSDSRPHHWRSTGDAVPADRPHSRAEKWNPAFGAMHPIRATRGLTCGNEIVETTTWTHTPLRPTLGRERPGGACVSRTPAGATAAYCRNEVSQDR